MMFGDVGGIHNKAMWAKHDVVCMFRRLLEVWHNKAIELVCDV